MYNPRWPNPFPLGQPWYLWYLWRRIMSYGDHDRVKQLLNVSKVPLLHSQLPLIQIREQLTYVGRFPVIETIEEGKDMSKCPEEKRKVL